MDFGQGRHMPGLLLAVCAGLLFLCFSGTLSTAQQQATAAWPSRAVTILVPYPPGGSIDILARIVGQKLQDALGQSVLVENRAGAAGTIGSAIVARAQADGYTLLMNASVHVISPYILKTAAYDPVDDFTAVSEISAGPLLIVANKRVPANNVSEFLQLARTDPAKFVYATSGFGAAGHLAVELLRRLASKNPSDTTLINFNGAGPALNQMLVGDIQVMIDPVLSSYPFVESGSVKALGITGAKRIRLLPDVPTVIELGVPELEFYSWYGLWGPKGLPTEIAQRLSREIGKIVVMPDIQKRLQDSGFEPRGTTPDQFSRYLVGERDKYLRILTDIDIKPR